jgi:glutathione S-transferase
MSLQIYGIARTRAFRALWVAKELGIDYEHRPIEIGDAGARTPEFLAINPNGRLPVIVDGDFVLFESLAITMYLAKKHSPGKLYPASLEGEARTWQWRLWAVTEVDRGVAERDAGKREEALKVLVAPFKVLDAAVAKELYLLGNEFTVADLNVAAVISRAVDMDLSASSNLKAWLDRCLDRPAAREALALKSKADRETPADVTRRIARINRL